MDFSDMGEIYDSMFYKNAGLKCIWNRILIKFLKTIYTWGKSWKKTDKKFKVINFK